MPSDNLPVLPDVLDAGLRVVFCGSAAGGHSAESGAYYAHPGNQFWPTLFQVGFTPRLLAPEEFAHVLDFGLGLTDLNKRESGMDHVLSDALDDPAGLVKKMKRFRPRVLAFSGKRPAKAFLQRDTDYGFQSEQIGETRIFVLPSPAGAGRRYWDVTIWQELADYVK